MRYLLTLAQINHLEDNSKYISIALMSNLFMLRFTKEPSIMDAVSSRSTLVRSGVRPRRKNHPTAGCRMASERDLCLASGEGSDRCRAYGQDDFFARMFDQQGAEKGIGGFIVIRDPEKGIEPRGLCIADREPTMGLRGMPEARIVIENLEVADDMVLRPSSGFRRGFAELMNAYNSQRVGAATVALGIAAGAFDLARDQGACRRIATAVARLGNGERQ
jgi:hypothetical protein